MHIVNLIVAIFITFLALSAIIAISKEVKLIPIYLWYLFFAAVAIALNLHSYIIIIDK